MQGSEQAGLMGTWTKFDGALSPKAHFALPADHNLNTHSAASFYETFKPEAARRLAERFEFHYTPKHGSWLNMAEIELDVLICQCLSQHISNKDTLEKEVKAWQADRNAKVVKVDWRFTTADARIKLTHLYPVIEV